MCSNSVWSPNVHTEILLTWCHGKSRAIVHSTTLWLQKILLYYYLFFLHLIVFSFLSFPLSLTHTPFPLLSMEWCMCIVSVVAEGPCLCSVSLYSFVKCGFGRRLVGRVQGGRWQQQASLFLSPSLLLPLLSPLLHWPLAVSVGSVLCVAHFFFMHDVCELASPDLARRGWHWSSRQTTDSAGKLIYWSLLHTAGYTH